MWGGPRDVRHGRGRPGCGALRPLGRRARGHRAVLSRRRLIGPERKASPGGRYGGAKGDFESVVTVGEVPGACTRTRASGAPAGSGRQLHFFLLSLPPKAKPVESVFSPFVTSHNSSAVTGSFLKGQQLFHP